MPVLAWFAKFIHLALAQGEEGSWAGHLPRVAVVLWAAHPALVLVVGRWAWARSAQALWAGHLPRVAVVLWAAHPALVLAVGRWAWARSAQAQQ
jgi:hypothetical protein